MVQIATAGIQVVAERRHASCIACIKSKNQPKDDDSSNFRPCLKLCYSCQSAQLANEGQDRHGLGRTSTEKKKISLTSPLRRCLHGANPPLDLMYPWENDLIGEIHRPGHSKTLWSAIFEARKSQLRRALLHGW